MALFRVLFRAVFALVIVLLMMLVVFPLTAAHVFLYMMGSGSGVDFLVNMIRNIFFNHPDVIRVSRTFIAPEDFS